MRFLPTRIHGIIDYLWSVALIAAPFLFGFATGGAAQWTAWIFGAGGILYSLLTAYEMGPVKILPISLHLMLDAIAGALLVVSPWVLGFSGQTFAPHLLFGLFAVAASLITRTEPPLRLAARERA